MLSNGTYTVTPNKDYYTFSPASRPVIISGGWSEPEVDFTASENFSISGKVTGEIKAGITMTLSGSVQTTTTYSSGNYSFTGLKSGTYTVTPSEDGYYFTPESWQGQVTPSTPNVTNVNFTSAAYHSISGTVTGDIQADVTITISGPVSKETKTVTSGNYEFTGLKKGTYTVTPSKDYYYFEPESWGVTLTGADVTGQDFTSAAYPSISGMVTLSSGSIGSVKDVTIMMVYESVFGDTTYTTTTASGEYSSTKTLKKGTYEVIPRKTGYSFVPTSLQVPIDLEDVTGKDFVATSIAIWSISGTVFGEGECIGVVNMHLSGSKTTDTTTYDSLGNYRFSKLRNGTYTVTPSKPTKCDCSYNPSSLSVTIFDGDAPDKNFTASKALTYSISGTVTCSGKGLKDVYVFLAGDATKNTKTYDASGNYKFEGLCNGLYTVTPSDPNYTFVPSSTPVEVKNGNKANINFACVTTTYSISGTVTYKDSGLAFPGVTMTLSGTSSGITTTVASGNYSFTQLLNGTYTVTPSKACYTFSPTNRQVTISGANVIGADFEATPSPLCKTYSICGTVTCDDKAGLTMTLSGGVSTTTLTDTSGNYCFTELLNGTYTVTPSKTNCTFTPASSQVTINNADVPNVNFTCTCITTFSISGTVSGDTQADVTITILYDSVSGDTTTNTSGNYTYSGLSNGTYTVTPSKDGYYFIPPNEQVIISGADVPGVDFVAFAVGVCSTWADVITKYQDYVNGQAIWADVIDCYQKYSSTFSISGTVTGDIQAGVTLTLSGDISATTTTDASGNYRFSGLSNGTYTVTPSKLSYTFTPSSRTVIISGADVTGVNFTVMTPVGACSTWADVNAKYEDYIMGEATWADVMDCLCQAFPENCGTGIYRRE